MSLMVWIMFWIQPLTKDFSTDDLIEKGLDAVASRIINAS